MSKLGQLLGGDDVREHGSQWLDHRIIAISAVQSAVSCVIQIVPKIVNIYINLLIDFTIGVAHCRVKNCIWDVEGFNKRNILGS